METYIYDNTPLKIPSEFYPNGANQPFTNCTVCKCDLLKEDKLYVIEKAHCRDLGTGELKTIFEFAYCLSCIEVLRKEVSEESKQNLDKYMAEKTDLETRNRELEHYKLYESDIWLNNCVINNKSLDEINEYQIYALCSGEHLLNNHFPFMISGDALEDAMQILSKSTKDFLEDFWLEHVDLPPEFEDIFKTKPVMF